MKTLEKTFRKFGEDFVQIHRAKDVAIYQRGNSYEVIIVQKSKTDREIAGKVVTQAGDEYYPSSEQFGSKAWYFTSKEKAMIKFIKKVEEAKKCTAS